MRAASIILATYCPNSKRHEFAERAFDTIHNTGIKRKDYELIVIDNGGIHANLIDGLDTDIILTSNRNIGQAAALNAGIALALSDNLIVAHDDMNYKDGWLRRGLKMLRKYRNYVVSIGEYEERYVTGKAGKNALFVRKIGGVIFFRRGLFNKVGRFGLTYYSHGGLWIRNLLRKKSRIVVSADPPSTIHIGKGKSIVAGKRSMILEYRKPRSLF